VSDMRMTMVALMSLSSLATAQTADKDLRLEAEIRRLDQDAARAIQQKDEAAIRRFFTPYSVTNNPRNGLTKGSAGVIEAARANIIDYHSFERNIESVQLLGDTAVVMGNEIVVFRGTDGKPGSTVRRRYTNIWMKRQKQWAIVARHANIVCAN
jgi:ketosteroid isomerase-like protein